MLLSDTGVPLLPGIQGCQSCVCVWREAAREMKEFPRGRPSAVSWAGATLAVRPLTLFIVRGAPYATWQPPPVNHFVLAPATTAIKSLTSCTFNPNRTSKCAKYKLNV